jgi:hypothetical protein
MPKTSETDEMRCAGPGCGRWLEPSTGPTPRKWCSDVCRKRAARAAAVRADLDAGAKGHVGESVDALVESLDAASGTLADSLGSLARSTARLVDQGQPQAVAQLRLTLEALDEAARITERASGEAWFDCFDIWCGLTQQGIRRGSEVGRALEAWMREHGMSESKLMPFDRPWACTACGHREDRPRGRRSPWVAGNGSG